MPLDSAGPRRRLSARARTHRAWTGAPSRTIRCAPSTSSMKWGPTSSNCCPARIVFVTTPRRQGAAATARSIAGNVAQTMAAPATAIIAYDLEFYEKLPLLVPHRDARSDFVGKPELIRVRSDAERDAAGRLSHHRRARARASTADRWGLRPRQGRRRVLPGQASSKSNFLCNLGYGDPSGCARAHRGLRSRTPADSRSAGHSLACFGPSVAQLGGDSAGGADQSIRSYAGSVRNSTNVSLATSSAKIPAASSYLPRRIGGAQQVADLRDLLGNHRRHHFLGDLAAVVEPALRPSGSTATPASAKSRRSPRLPSGCRSARRPGPRATHRRTGWRR